MFIDEVFAGRYRAAPPITSFPNVSRLNQLMIVGPITVRSACSHHLCPIMGKIWIGVLPNTGAELIGLSKFARLCDWIRSEEHTSELQSLMRISYAVFCLKKKKYTYEINCYISR